ncbi:uncharacterized protein LOC125585868 [Brassica napus]|uniref:uncharacterized protein LOC125585868 n=1 Tax=Brassica napus TaxID=3708 RepID=UPI0020796569|nr:uncharacterized protein LOC125585868 [Brassica napus]
MRRKEGDSVQIARSYPLSKCLQIVGWKRAGRVTVRCRLDRAVGNADWHEKFPHSNVKYLRLWGSDHRSILADILTKPTRRSMKFKFDRRWLDNEELRQVILEGWKSPDLPPNANIMEHISSCRKALSEWRKQHNINSAKLVEELKDKVEGLYADDNATTEEITAALKELSDALKQRRARNKITQLLDVNGNIVEDEEGLVAIATSYFRQIFESSTPEDIEEALSEVPTTITGTMNDSLTAPVSEWEVKLALFAMHPDKAPGPDGMTALFYQQFWDIVKQDLTLMVNKFIYKIVSKVLCQRLKKVSPGLISETQSAFVAGRQISDNIMIAQEMFHALRTKPSGRNKRMAIKIDMSKDNLMHRVNGWTGRWLSKGGKEVMIKSILLALPTYVMSTFLLPLEICENLASAIAQFWWSSNPPKRGIHWAKWDKRLVQYPDSLAARVLRGRYYRMTSPLRVTSTSSPSYVWTSISAARKLLLLGIRQKIHSGYDVRVWEDPWIPTTPARPARPIALVMNLNMRVSDIINQESKEWDVGLLDDYVHPDDIPLIRSMAISSTHRRDTFCWNYTRNGQYTVKSGYWVAQNLFKQKEEKEILEPSITKLQAFAWKLKAPRKMCHLIWQLIRGQVAVTRNLVRRNMRCDNYCPKCGEIEESVTHAIFECPPALQVWSLSVTPTSPGIFPVASVYTNMDYLFWRKNNIIVPDQDRDPYPWIIWYIWKARNDKLFRGIDRDPLELVRNAESECQAWFNANEMIPPQVRDSK